MVILAFAATYVARAIIGEGNSDVYKISSFIVILKFC